MALRNSTLNRPMPIRALDDNRTQQVYLCEHLIDFGNGERRKGGIVVQLLLMSAYQHFLQTYQT